MSPTKDRLQEMLQIQNGGKDNYTTAEGNDQENKAIDKLLQKAEAIRENINELKSNTTKVNEILENNQFKVVKVKQDELDILLKNNTTIAYRINKLLKEFERSIKAKDALSTEYRITNLQYLTLKQDFQEALQENNNCLVFHRNKRKELLIKSLKIVKTDVEEEELESLLDENKLDIFTDNLLITTETAKLQLRDIEERHKELLNIERHLNEVLDLFMNVATLVEQQQESIDRVEYHAMQATDLVEIGTNEIQKTKRTKKKSRKMQIIIGIGITLLVVIILILLFK